MVQISSNNFPVMKTADDFQKVDKQKKVNTQY